MKTLLLFRHGKSDWHADYSHDHQRPLARRGRRAARAMGRWLTHIGPMPDQIISSTALRTRQTCHFARKAGDWAAPVEYEGGLYGADPMDLLDCIRAAPDSSRVLMLIGHQPTWSETIAGFTGRSVMRFPTAAMARVDLPVESWLDVEFGLGTLVWLQIPKELPAAYGGR
ncbi:MAG: histidine phosphatase family protein [Bacteroidota bacterium]|nr:histidine phosphatase family protein [Bacteroidota bacterium]MDE2957732.1 histidine phosphatase family protein [Bacteroidota bacterium]